MEESEYKEKLKKIEEDYSLAKKNLYYEFAMSKAKFIKGEIIKDSRWIILIDKITAYKGLSLPEPVYSGIELNKDLSPKKNGSRQSIYGNHDIEIVENKKNKKS